MRKQAAVRQADILDVLNSSDAPMTMPTRFLTGPCKKAEIDAIRYQRPFFRKGASDVV